MPVNRSAQSTDSRRKFATHGKMPAFSKRVTGQSDRSSLKANSPSNASLVRVSILDAP